MARHDIDRRSSWCAAVGMACLMLPSPGFAETSATLLARAVTCQLRDDELVTFEHSLVEADPSFLTPARRYFLPSYNRYTSRERVSAFGYASNDIILMPGRVAMLVPAMDRKKIEQQLGLKRDDPFPSAKTVGPDRSVVAYELHQQGMSGRLLLGCQYDSAAARWGAD